MFQSACVGEEQYHLIDAAELRRSEMAAQFMALLVKIPSHGRNRRSPIERLMSCASRNCEREADEAAACRQGKRSIMARLEPYRYLKL